MPPTRTQRALNDDGRTAYDERNVVARQHEGHELYAIRSLHRTHPTTSGFDEIDVICRTCGVQYKAYAWRPHKDARVGDGKDEAAP
jgi:hypothetical protein